jgi:hypothetical protein
MGKDLQCLKAVLICNFSVNYTKTLSLISLIQDTGSINKQMNLQTVILSVITLRECLH